MKKKKLIMIGGLPGSGKSYLAEAINQHLDSVYLSSDTIRKYINRTGRYTDADKQLVYDELIDKISNNLISEKIIIVDTTFQKRELRNRILELALKYETECYFILTTASEETIKQRTSKKRADSEADYEVYILLKQSYDPVLMKHLVINTDDISKKEMISKVLSYCNINND